ncbi:efflux RND transporter periplasmic adaptor subunit [Bryobacter aggregatus]|uniref:efflux RND transporter periplasmic adaptor subunit n=1 Tax=Bryobacter aggregatus TaxID=360054 RepID=UPI00068E83D2|nr:efflux RND transporter periplasmic adaptor subunit [Bryobacter aggregatus]
MQSRFTFLLILSLGSQLLLAQAVDVVTVRSEKVRRTILLPGEILPFQSVALHARASGFVDRMLVDRGSVVKEGQTLALLIAPELGAETSQAESQVHITESLRAEAKARLAGVQATYERLKAASATVGAIAGNELVQAEKAVEAALAALRAADNSVRSAEAAQRATKQSEGYLKVVAPFSGTITRRYVHPGALVGPGNGSAGPLLDLEQISRLRLVVAVPEAETAGVKAGTPVEFRVPAYPGRSFAGKIARIDRSLDPNTRSMPVELDVSNPNQELSPGMYPAVTWPVGGVGESLLLPPSAIVTTTERSFVIRLQDGRAEWVNVKKGPPAGELVQVMGALKAGDLIVRRGSDEIREGTALQPKYAK